jgi:hypothetical protein
LIEAKKARESTWIKCQIVGKDSVGKIHLHARRWRPKRVFEVVYYAPGDGKWEVPETKWEAMLGSQSHLEAMAVLRRS